MFNPTELVIDSFVAHLRESYARIYTTQEPAYPGIIDFVGRAALENIANSDAPYHDVNHTIMVTLVGQEILTGKHMLEAASPPQTGSISSFPCCATTSDTFAASARKTTTVSTSPI